MRFAAEDIVKVIPHRPPFLLIDSVEIIEFGKRGVGIKELIRKEKGGGSFGDFFDAYLPDRRIMPRSMIIEAAAQTGAFVVAGEGGGSAPAIGYLVKIGNFSFDGDVKEGDTLKLNVELGNVFGALYRFDITAEAGGVEIARGSLTFSVETASGGD